AEFRLAAGMLGGAVLVGTTEYDYDNANRLTAVIHRDGADQPLEADGYAYDAADRLIAKNADGFITNYSYDNTNQLITEGLQGYGYDATGNRNAGGNVAGPGNRLVTDGVWVYGYDDEGNLTAKVALAGGQRWDYAYDLQNKMTAAAHTVGGFVVEQIAYTYD